MEIRCFGSEPGSLSQVACVICHNPLVNSHRERVLVLHGDGKEGIMVVPELPEIPFLVMSKQPPSGPSILSLDPACPEDLVTKQQVFCVNFCLLAESFDRVKFVRIVNTGKNNFLSAYFFKKTINA